MPLTNADVRLAQTHRKTSCSSSAAHADPNASASTHLVNQNCKRGQVEEHVGLGFVCRICCEAFANNTVPIRTLLAIEELLNVARDVFLILILAHCQGSLLDSIAQHVAALIGVCLDFLTF